MKHATWATICQIKQPDKTNYPVFTQDINFSDPARGESSKSHILIKDFNTFIHSYREEGNKLWVPDCGIPVYVIESLSLSQNLPVGMLCLPCTSFLWRSTNWYRNFFISMSSPDMELTCYLLLKHTYHLCFHFLTTTSCVSLDFIFITHFLSQTLNFTTVFLMFVQGHLQWNFWY